MIYIFRQSGFTLIELIVAMGLFVVIMAIAGGSFINALRSQRAVSALMSANDNASLTLEQMAREIRTGFDFRLGRDGELKFANADGEAVAYRLADDSVERGAGTQFKKITSESVKIGALNFTIFDDPDYPPRITVTMSVGAKERDVENIYTNVQTTVSARMF